MKINIVLTCQVIYAIIAQMRLLGAAAMSTLMLKRHYTPLQWMILSVLTLLVVSFSILSASGQGGGGFLGYLLCFGKALFCVVSVVYAEKHLSADRSFFVQAFWISIVIVPTLAVSFVVTMWNDDLDVFSNGFFGGFDFGWDWRTIILMFFMMYYSMVPNGCVKVTSALTLKMTNTASMILIFILYSVLYQQKPEAVKVLLCVSIGLTVAIYVVASHYTPTPKVQAREP